MEIPLASVSVDDERKLAVGDVSCVYCIVDRVDATRVYSLAPDVWLGAVLLYSRKTYHKKKCGNQTNQTSLKGTRVDIKKTLCVYVYLQQDSLPSSRIV